jgi:L-lactate dehydrogenase complex protein LldG
MSAARDEILSRIRKVLADVPASETPEMVPIPRSYRTTEISPRPLIVNLFMQRVAEYKAIVRRVPCTGLLEAISASCMAQGVRTLVTPPDLPETWAPQGIVLFKDHGLSYTEIDASDGVLTGCALAVAQTGTIILDGGPVQGRRALSLLPDYHVCIVQEDQIVGLVTEAVSRLAHSGGMPDRPMTWISGPSATSDIELSRVEGVHGPRRLEVLVVFDGGV